MLTRRSPFLSAPVRALGEIGALFRLATRKERRAHPRIPGKLTGEISIRRADLGLPGDANRDGKIRESVPVRVHDVSRGGVGFTVLSQDLPRGNLSLLGLKLDLLPARVPVTLRLQTPRGSAVVRGEITSRELVEPESAHLAVELGMSFLADEEIPRVLRNWVDYSHEMFVRARKALVRRSAGIPVARELVATLGFVGLDDGDLQKLIHRAAESLGLERRTA